MHTTKCFYCQKKMKVNDNMHHIDVFEFKKGEAIYHRAWFHKNCWHDYEFDTRKDFEEIEKILNDLGYERDAHYFEVIGGYSNKMMPTQNDDKLGIEFSKYERASRKWYCKSSRR